MRLDSQVTPGRVSGPYVYDGRRWVTVEDGDRKRGMTYARWLMQEHLGRELDSSEHVHHVDEDKLNDCIENYRVLSVGEHGREHSGPMEMTTFVCPVCGAEATKRAQDVRNNRRQGKAGPFCGRSCAGKYKRS